MMVFFGSMIAVILVVVLVVAGIAVRDSVQGAKATAELMELGD